MLETERLILRKWTEADADSLFEYAKDPDVGPIAGWPPHKSVAESLDVIRNVLNGKECYAICEKGSEKAIGAIELKLNGHAGFVYHHTCDEVPVPLMNDIRIADSISQNRSIYLQQQRVACMKNKKLLYFSYGG